MAFKFIVLLILIKTIICGNYDEKDLENNRISLASNFPFKSEIQVMKNVSYYCYAKFDCKIKDCEHQLLPIQWFLPRELRENELLYGVNSARVEFSKQSTDWLDNTTFLIRSAMYITDIGLIHNGTYSCGHDSMDSNMDFTVNVKGIETNAVIYYYDKYETHLS